MPKQAGHRRTLETIHHANTREESEPGTGRKEKWGEGGREGDRWKEVDFMRHQFPLKNGREQRARWSVAVVVGSESDDGDDGRAGHFQGHGFARSHEQSSAK